MFYAQLFENDLNKPHWLWSILNWNYGVMIMLLNIFSTGMITYFRSELAETNLSLADFRRRREELDSVIAVWMQSMNSELERNVRRENELVEDG